MLKDLQLTENFYPLNLISLLKSKFSEYFHPLNFNLNADFQKFNAEIPFTPSYLELHIILIIY